MDAPPATWSTVAAIVAMPTAIPRANSVTGSTVTTAGFELDQVGERPAIVFCA